MLIYLFYIFIFYRKILGISNKLINILQIYTHEYIIKILVNLRQTLPKHITY